ncbi:hypothetical protein [Pseudoalteromonas piscicida]|uniref:hypothetical protein n=1 Tax=Pseudoalteromonas piscicida TaxID=43662 RepID=UPI001CB717FA|nr:hypothetical protein [Pseudoalteromonas piscicida]
MWLSAARYATLMFTIIMCCIFAMLASAETQLAAEVLEARPLISVGYGDFSKAQFIASQETVIIPKGVAVWLRVTNLVRGNMSDQVLTVARPSMGSVEFFTIDSGGKLIQISTSNIHTSLSHFSPI